MRDQTSLVHTRRAPTAGFSSLSVPTHRGSTVLYPDYGSFITRGQQPRSAYTYGLHGTPTTRTLQDKITELEGGTETFLTSSGLMAITTAIMAVVGQGDSVLLPDTVYPPVRRFANETFPRFGIRAKYYDPMDLPADQITGDRVRLIWVESPGSTTMEIQDLPAIVDLAAKHHVLVGCDNSWASPIFCKPLEHGADIVVEAVTKYLSGHSDLLLGSITTGDDRIADNLHRHVRSLGIGVSPDDCFLALRGIETSNVRLRQIEHAAVELACHIDQQVSVAEVLHPALSSFKSHRLWKKLFKGSSGLFSFVMIDEPEKKFAERFDRLRFIRIGASWGGTQTILAPTILSAERTVNRAHVGRRIVRVSTGLEALEDLIAEMESFLA